MTLCGRTGCDTYVYFVHSDEVKNEHVQYELWAIHALQLFVVNDLVGQD